jgi:N-glycosylase/DNA lyase
VSSDHQPVNIDNIRAAHRARRKEIQTRLSEFRSVWREGSDDRLWEELVFCIFTAGASARMGLRSVEAVRPFLKHGGSDEMTKAIKHAGAHRFPIARPAYIVSTRDFLRSHCRMRLRQALQDFADPLERRDWLAQEDRIKGLGFKEASHFLRNVGFKGYGILDKHVMRCLADLGVVETAKPPTSRVKYLDTERRLKQLARDIGINFDELDLVLWSMKTGEVLK